MLTKNQYSRQGRPPYFSNFVVLTMGSTSDIDEAIQQEVSRFEGKALLGQAF